MKSIFKKALLPFFVACLCLKCLTANHVLFPELRAQAELIGTSPHGRFTAFVSDFHMGIGLTTEGKWHPREDFRWPRALDSLLDELSRRGNGRVDLVIVGDFLELWQPPAEIECFGDSGDLGCTIEEMVAIINQVIKAHRVSMDALREFSKQDKNKIYIIPGNHDAALLVDAVWKRLAETLDAASGRVELVSSGVWVSPDGRTVVEHGHQIGRDANRYRDWPEVLRQGSDGQMYIVRPWGERFVQQVFNDREDEFPIIDNLAPETVGARYHLARGIWGAAQDIAGFVSFNLFETSLRQKWQGLGPPRGGEAEADWSVEKGRSLGHQLFTLALPPDDPFRVRLLEDTAEAAAVREELDALASDQEQLPEEQVRLLCDQIVLRGAQERCVDDVPLGAVLESKLVPRAHVIKTHLKERGTSFPNMRTFIYGHTHQLEEGWDVKLDDSWSVTVFNIGAFQRVMDESGYLRRVHDSDDPELTETDGLRKLGLEQFPACYTVVLPVEGESAISLRTMRWYAPEEAPVGRFVAPDDPACN